MRFNETYEPEDEPVIFLGSLSKEIDKQTIIDFFQNHGYCVTDVVIFRPQNIQFGNDMSACVKFYPGIDLDDMVNRLGRKPKIEKHRNNPAVIKPWEDRTGKASKLRELRARLLEMDRKDELCEQQTKANEDASNANNEHSNADEDTPVEKEASRDDQVISKEIVPAAGTENETVNSEVIRQNIENLFKIVYDKKAPQQQEEDVQEDAPKTSFVEEKPLKRLLENEYYLISSKKAKTEVSVRSLSTADDFLESVLSPEQSPKATREPSPLPHYKQEPKLKPSVPNVSAFIPQIASNVQADSQDEAYFIDLMSSLSQIIQQQNEIILLNEKLLHGHHSKRHV